MKQFALFILFALFCSLSASAEINPATAPVASLGNVTDVKAIDPALVNLAVNKFLDLTPREYKNITGKKLGLKNTIALKMAQKKVRHEVKNGDITAPDSGISKGLYIVLALIGWGFVGIGLKSDWEGNDWWVNLLLTFLCWLPGFIHALVVMKKYY